LSASAFVAHPYHWPVVGWPSDIESWTMDDLKAHFRMGYAPNNCVMVVTGDVTDAEIVALSKKYLEPIPRQEPPPPVRTKEPEQQGERRVKLTLPAQLPLLMMAWHSTTEADPDSRALDLLATVLDAGRSSRLQSLLVEQKQIALNVNARNAGALDPNLFQINAQLRKGTDPAVAEKEIGAVLASIAESGVTEAELSKARNQMLTRLFDQLKTIAGTANLLGTLEVFRGDAGLVNKLAAEFDKVTPADVQRVAKKYLKPDNLTVATLIPAAASSSKEASR
jgi:zinc protease